MVNRIILLFIIIFCTFLNSYAALYKLNATDAVEMALKNSLDAKNIEYREQIKLLYKNNSWNSFFPDLSAGFNMGRNNTLSSSALNESDRWSMGFSASARLTVRPSYFKNIEYAVLDYENAIISRKVAKRDIKINVLKAYNELIAMKNTVEVYESQLKNSKTKADQSTIAYRNGLIPEVDYLTAKLDYDKSIPTLQGKVIVYENAKEVFKLLLGIGLDDEIEITGELALEEIDPKLLDSTVDIYSLPDIRALQNDFQISKNLKDSIWLDTFLPNFNVSYAYSPGKNFSSIRTNDFVDRGSFSFGISYNISNLFPWSSNFTKIEEKDYELQILMNRTELKVRNLKSEIVQKKKDIERYKVILEASVLNLELAKRTYSIAFNAFNAGTVDLSKLNDIELNYKNTELQLIKDKLEYSNSILIYKNLINSLD